jgi:hypothetical protein
MKDLTQIIFKCYKAGLKTWVYYTRVMPGAMAQQVSVEPESPSGAARKPHAEDRRGAPAETRSSVQAFAARDRCRGRRVVRVGPHLL